MSARMNDAIHVEVEVVELHLVRVRLRSINGWANAIYLWRLK